MWQLRRENFAEEVRVCDEVVFDPKAVEARFSVRG